jgi:hypothetical protein
MNANEANARESIDLPSDAYRLGVDDEGRDHWHSPMSTHLWTLRDGDVVHEESLTERSVVEWVLFVDELCGWDQRQPVEESGGVGSIIDDLADELEVA